MTTMRRALVAFAAACMLSSCGGSGGSSSDVPLTAASAFARGHRLYETGHPVEAEPDLRRAAALDSTMADPLVDLGSIYYERGSQEQAPTRRDDDFREARSFLARADELGYAEAAGYDRLCELCSELHDARGFLKYARKSVDRYPYDRQYYNLGVAYADVEDWPAVVKSQREAAEKFRQSQYVAAYYRQLGRAYMKMDRDQTAERTLEAGLPAVDARIAAVRKGAQGSAPGELKRLQEDRVGMLTLLKRLYSVYKEADKLSQVERLLAEAGAPR
ncbi:MAG TPA: hypothetical protein VL221_12770 [Bacteroidota bacterium]|nr:hypothetical protein [Bacteroidota bacterium]